METLTLPSPKGRGDFPSADDRLHQDHPGPYKTGTSLFILPLWDLGTCRNLYTYMIEKDSKGK